ncbi:MAG TPA: type II CAAX endopeptidase family protein [Candidatus Paceibacterota bacterium]|nr:type II CAAX endopeptidase family protein [Candidatus Paceibacterota bacterium]
MDSIKKERELVWLQILYLFILPVLLLYFKVLPGDFRFIMLLGVALLLLGIIRYNHWTYKDMGIEKNFMKDIIPYSLFTVGGVLFLIWLSNVVPHEPFLNWWKSARFLLLFIPLSVLQEIIFRGILMNMLRRAFSNPIFIIGLNACVFSLMHVIYLNFVFVLPMTFIAGVGFAWMYYRYGNLPLISISHTILNFTAMILGFFVIR